MKPWAEQFYNSDAWRSCRDSFLKSKGGLCERCSTPHDPIVAKIAHHKTYLTKQNINDPNVALSWDTPKARLIRRTFKTATKRSWDTRTTATQRRLTTEHTKISFTIARATGWRNGRIGAERKNSPAAVVGEIKTLGLSFKAEISEKTIYNYIDKGIFLRLERKNLPQGGKRKRKYNGVKRKSARASVGESIESRPQEINDRETFGHWEMDCVEGKKKTKETLLVLSERLTRREIIIKMPDHTSASVVAALNKLERKYGRKFAKVFKSITVDNGSEFLNCEAIEKSVYGNKKRTTVYYCHPYSAYERGTNENINKMIRRFLPKGTDFRKVTAAYIKRVETWINNYPREILGFETAEMRFQKCLAAAA